MLHIVISISRFALVLLFAFYTYSCFGALKSGISEEKQDALYCRQTACMYLFLLISNGIMFLTTFDRRIVFMLGMECVYFILVSLIYKHIYRRASLSLTNNMCMLLSVSFVILTRLSFEKAYKQLVIAAFALVVTCLIPLLVSKLKFWNHLTYVYALVGILGLGVVAVAGNTSYGAKLSLTVGEVSLQPSEIIKILFVFFVASMLYEEPDEKKLKLVTVIAGFHVVLLIASRDLGGSGIFFLTYLVMLFTATQKPLYLFAGMLSGAIGLVMAYFLFSHVRVRVMAWKDPLSVVDGAGYQVSHSLFAIGTGGWFGSGLYQGMPQKIPVVEKDFIFSAISEELGGVFALCLIFICISCFLMMFNIAMQIHDPFYKLIALGLGTVYATQTFLTLGGVIRFIPSTGVTLPLVSYGGSSLVSTMTLFAIIQGLYVLRGGEVWKRRDEAAGIRK